jgi:hypothetical protein
MSMKNCNDTIGNRTRDLPACSAVPQPTAPPRTPFTESYETEKNIMCGQKADIFNVALGFKWKTKAS